MNKLSHYIGRATSANPITLHFNNGCNETFTSIERKHKGSTLCICIDSNGEQGVYSASESVSLVETVDCTPSWRSIIDIHAQAYATGSLAAQSEIHRCACQADKLIAVVKLLTERSLRGDTDIDIASLLAVIS